ncbi:PSD1 and planctomycete cytochrome C domain-containing protein [Roseibacillus ishigakijimensis]|uniref:PSD1 domain-containing protein n=1 Tax=Roseibacillus ishigakijimensis TaxID=454146 RepID=A0A934RMD1_9BACT|nr:PSD1 and planctomycete cytochrome C domain-containing protein [Roseibacillus ishigakijimensis]MBK1834442.1 PSD1 domain-containing protein [Roseibacillus ishigakijimensis]
MVTRAFFFIALSFSPLAGKEAISFARDIRPILSDRCFKCHGFDDQTREAGLGLHTFAEATRDLGGYQAIKPGHPEESEFMVRILSHDPDEVMPTPQANKPRLSEEEAALFHQWIAEGASYEKHWAFEFPQRPAVPEEDDGWARNAIDHFVSQRLREQNLFPQDEADPITLLRRVSFDLTGLPPTLAESDPFLAAWEKDPEAAWSALLDRLLASPAYGERWARQWLDLARYADTNGYEKDRARSIWPWRDWVINALNADMPYDQFSIEQLAGDMLPDATLEQKIATGFHRNTMLNEEGGIDPLEYRYHALVDRVATTGTVWMGLTTGCAQCHTHKFDPILHSDYFGLMALLNQSDEPALAVPDAEFRQKQKKHDEQIAAEETSLLAQIGEEDFAQWLAEARKNAAPWTTLQPATAEADNLRLNLEDEGVVFASGDFTKRDRYRLSYPLGELGHPVTSLRLEALTDERLPGQGPGACYYEGRHGTFHLSEITLTHQGRKVAVASASDPLAIDGNSSSGWGQGQAPGKAHDLILTLSQPLPPEGDLQVKLLFERHFVAALAKFRLSATPTEQVPQPRQVPTLDLLTATPAELRQIYLRTAPAMAEARKPLLALEEARPQAPTTLVMQERPADHQRVTHLRNRGEYLQPREAIAPHTPEFLPGLPAGVEPDRLALARWLVDPERNPLIGRVTVNRAWQSFFGRGFIISPADFGYQSDLPSHPELLDWLAVEFVKNGWSLKSLHRLIVDSATYRQSSSASPSSWQADPQNRWLSRGPRLRLEAEMIRDAALKSSGLLTQKIGGPSVRPPQPASVSGAAYGSPPWPAATGPDRYRRSLYTFAKRTAPFAAYLTFDGPSSEVCLPARERSNTPLQALTLLNDEMFTEAAVGLVQNHAPTLTTQDPADSVTFLFRHILTRHPEPSEKTALLDFFQRQHERFASGELNPRPFGESPTLAAWTLLARSLFNLDEAVTKN